MSRFLTSLFAFAAMAASPASAEEPRASRDLSVADLSLEVSALQTLYILDLTRPQAEALKRLANDASSKPLHESLPQASRELRKTLADLRTALVDAKDDKRINELADRLDALRDKEDIDLGDNIDLTEEATERAPEALRLLTPRQVAGYLASLADDIGDPRGLLRDALEKIRGVTDEQASTLREEVAAQVEQLIAGLDGERSARLHDQVVQLLIVARTLKDSEFRDERRNLERRVDQILGPSRPTDVLRNVVEESLAELLANPRLTAALDARLKALAKAPAVPKPSERRSAREPLPPSEGRR